MASVEKRQCAGVPSALETLKQHTIVVADTGDFEQLKAFKPTDGTTNPTLLLQAAQLPAYREVLDDAIAYARKRYTKTDELVEAVCDKLAVNFGYEILKVVPGVVSSEVDACLSFDVDGSVAKAKRLLKLYDEAGVPKDRILIKMASTWEGFEAARRLESEGIHCNMTLLFSLPQAIAAAQVKATVVSPFVGRILDWHKKAQGPDSKEDYSGPNDPGVKSVTAIYKYYKKHGVQTVVMGASFRNVGEIISLAGCDKLTISPALLDELSRTPLEFPRALSPDMDTSDAPDRIALTESSFRFMMNQDTAATDLLADGIRRFNADLEKLKAFIKETIGAK